MTAPHDNFRVRGETNMDDYPREAFELPEMPPELADALLERTTRVIRARAAVKVAATGKGRYLPH